MSKIFRDFIDTSHYLHRSKKAHGLKGWFMRLIAEPGTMDMMKFEIALIGVTSMVHETADRSKSQAMAKLARILNASQAHDFMTATGLAIERMGYGRVKMLLEPIFQSRDVLKRHPEMEVVLPSEYEEDLGRFIEIFIESLNDPVEADGTLKLVRSS